ncbi:hypothetical protein [Pseudomonas canadensis]|uniref:hypothetical protein n=1 Tax=Pseudomonas canadensis TaxID=915099 RepID=UPI003BA13FA4
MDKLLTNMASLRLKIEDAEKTRATSLSMTLVAAPGDGIYSVETGELDDDLAEVGETLEYVVTAVLSPD